MGGDEGAQDRGTDVSLRLTHIVVGQKPARHGKAIFLQLKTKAKTWWNFFFLMWRNRKKNKPQQLKKLLINPKEYKKGDFQKG